MYALEGFQNGNWTLGTDNGTMISVYRGRYGQLLRQGAIESMIPKAFEELTTYITELRIDE
jgi:hypothetical protein